MEIAIKSRLGRQTVTRCCGVVGHHLADVTAAELPIDAADAILAGRLPWDHKDPFDRVIVAQAARRKLTIATGFAHEAGTFWPLESTVRPSRTAKPRASSAFRSTPISAPGGTSTFLSMIAFRTTAPAPTVTPLSSTESETSAPDPTRHDGESTDFSHCRR